MLIGIGHPRCGTGFTASLLQQNGLDVGHETIRADGIVSWMQIARRKAGPWGDTLDHYPTGSRLFLVARSPLAALNSVSTDNQQIRSIAWRSQVIWERRGIDLFVWTNQTAGEGIYDYFGWAVMSLAYWFDICLEDKPDVIFRVENPEDDAKLGDLAGRHVTREAKDVWRNAHGPHKKSPRLEYPVEELGRVPKQHLAKLVEVADRLGYSEDALTLGSFL